MTVHDVMTRSCRTIGADTTIGEACRLLRVLRVSHLPVTNADGRLVGLVSKADFVELSKPRLVDELRGIQVESSMASVSSVMNDARVIVEADDDVEEALDLMAENKLTVLAVIDSDGAVVGIVSSSDVVRSLRSRALHSATP